MNGIEKVLFYDMLGKWIGEWNFWWFSWVCLKREKYVDCWSWY